MFENRTKSREASYVYILNGQKFIKNAKNGQFWLLLKSGASGQTVLSDRSLLIGQKLMKNGNKLKVPMRHFESFSNIVNVLIEL